MESNDVTEIDVAAYKELQNKLKPGKLNDDDMFRKLYLGVPLTHAEIADIFGVSTTAVTKRVKKLELKRAEQVDAETYFQEQFLVEMKAKVQSFMATLTADKISKASLQQTLTSLGILIDKINQLENKGQGDEGVQKLLIGYTPEMMKFLDQAAEARTKALLDQNTEAVVKELKENSVGEYEVQGDKDGV